MAEYMEREALLERLEASPLFTNIRDGGFFIKDGVLDLVRRQPAADVVEVRHGEWLEQLDGTHYCSECGHDATYTFDGTEICGIGCSFCYAKMDGKGEGG